MTSRIPPKNGSQFSPGGVIRLEFPAQGYINPSHTTIEFDCTLTYPTEIGATFGIQVRFQNNIQSIFNRVRVMYGSTPLEDIINYNVIVRNLTEWTAGNPHMTMDQSTISEGIGGVTVGCDSLAIPGLVNIRQKYIHGHSLNFATGGTAFASGKEFGIVPQTATQINNIPVNQASVTRRYQIQLATGLFTSEKLIPAKFMASQLAIELTLEQAPACIYVGGLGTGYLSGGVFNNLTQPTYFVSDVNLIPEVLEFDASYDDMFLVGLQNGGVPIKFSSWHTFLFSSASSSNVNLQVQERSRSVKAIFTVQRRSQPSYQFDNGACFFDTSSTSTTLQTFQTRVGSRYFPASPVQCADHVGGSASNGGAEAFIELEKALNILGDYRLSTPCNTTRWALQGDSGALFLQEYDFDLSLKGFNGQGQTLTDKTTTPTNCFSGDLGSACFAMACSLETSNGIEISGLNAEEQSDISVIAFWKDQQVTGNATLGGKASSLEVYTYYDAMIVLRENNVLELIQ